MGLEEFHEDAQRFHDEYDAFARDIIKTLPEEDWPVWVHNRLRMWADPDSFPDDWTHNSGWKFAVLDPDDLTETQIWDWAHSYATEEGEAPDHAVDIADRAIGLWRRMQDKPTANKFYFLKLDIDEMLGKISKTAAGLGIPANYTPEDPYDIKGKTPLINAMQVDWEHMPPEQAKQIIVNAFRATMLSPRMNLKSNAILYQSLMDIPADESNPDVFENAIRDLKARWDTQGQGEIGQDPNDIIDPNEILPGKFMPGFWGNIRRLAALGPHADELYKLAMDDMQHGGDGHIFRDGVLQMGIPGVQAKVASFAWLALAPNTSELATVDVHMMRHLDQEGDSPRNTKHYLELEDRLRNERDETYGTEVPLAHYQWGVWDARRTPGFHQDHTPLRAYQPTPFRDVAWPPTARPPRTRQAPEMNPGQQSLLGKWKRIPVWKISQGSYSLQGRVVADVPGLIAQGVAVRPDRQSQAEIMEIINNLSTHDQDSQKQRKQIPDWALNRGGKTAQDFRPGPGGVGVTYAPSVIAVTEWASPRENWLYEHDLCRGIIAEKGGGSSHAVVVARARNIAVVVDAPDATKIDPGDDVQMNAQNAIIYVNGGTTEDFGEAQVAEIPIIRFVWSKGHGLTAGVPQDDPESGTLHKEMIKQQFRQGQWDRVDNAMGVVFANGSVQMLGQPSDQQEMLAWLNTIHPVTNVQTGFSL